LRKEDKLPLDIEKIYRIMYRSRYFEQMVAGLWYRGIISGEMHLSMGEEAICAGINEHLEEGDALALDHRGTAPALMRGVDPAALLKEFLGKPDGLCRGQGGHMHLFAPDLMIASSGIVGAAGPAGAGFALAARYLRKGKISVAYFGEGAVNQGMLMESFNLAAAWQLPVLFVCKDNGWSITTKSEKVTGGNLIDRVCAFGIPGEEIDGTSIGAVWEAAGKMIGRIRRESKPGFLLARCVHLEGHFLGDPLMELGRKPLKKVKELGGGLVKSVLHPGGGKIKDRTNALQMIGSVMAEHLRPKILDNQDPLRLLREKLTLSDTGIEDLENDVKMEIDEIVTQAVSS
jgi:pyruvate dehydrogenase E1 component alpha subunit